MLFISSNMPITATVAQAHSREFGRYPATLGPSSVFQADRLVRLSISLKHWREVWVSKIVIGEHTDVSLWHTRTTAIRNGRKISPIIFISWNCYNNWYQKVQHSDGTCYTNTACHQNSTAPGADVNLPPTESLPLMPRVFLANRLNLVPAGAGADIGRSWLVASGSNGKGFALVFPLCWQLPVLPEHVDGYKYNTTAVIKKLHYKNFLLNY